MRDPMTRLTVMIAMVIMVSVLLFAVARAGWRRARDRSPARPPAPRAAGPRREPGDGLTTAGRWEVLLPDAARPPDPPGATTGSAIPMRCSRAAPSRGSAAPGRVQEPRRQ